MEGRAQAHNESVVDGKIEVESQVWLYLDRVKEGYARKLAHLWNGPFRVLEVVGEQAARLDITGPIIESTRWYTFRSRSWSDNILPDWARCWRWMKRSVLILMERCYRRTVGSPN